MDFHHFYKTLQQQERKHKHGFYRMDEICRWFEDGSRRRIQYFVKKAVRQRLLLRIHRGIYRVANTDTPVHAMFPHLVKALRPRSVNYVSLESVLSAHGIISQIPFVITITSTGASGRYDTEVGSVEFVHTKKDVEHLSPYLEEAQDGLVYADAELAYRELKRLNRNLHLVDIESLKEVLS